MQKIIFFFMAILCSTFGLVAQTQMGTIKGTVAYFGGALPNVLVRADSYLKAPTIMSRTDTAGNYQLSLPVGDYHISFFLEGHYEREINKVTVKANETLVLNQVLSPILIYAPDETSAAGDSHTATEASRATMSKSIPTTAPPPPPAA